MWWVYVALVVAFVVFVGFVVTGHIELLPWLRKD